MAIAGGPTGALAQGYPYFAPGGALSCTGACTQQSVDLSTGAFILNALAAANFPALAGGDCTTPGNSYVLTCTKTNGVAFGPAATIATTTGSGAVVLASAPTLTTPNLGTPSTLVLTNASSLPLSALANLGTTTTVLHGNASGNPSFSAVNLASDVTGTLPIVNLVSCLTTQIPFDNAGTLTCSAQLTWNDSTATLGLSSTVASTIQPQTPATGAGKNLNINAGGAGASGGGGVGGTLNFSGGAPGTGAAGGTGGTINFTVPNSTGSGNHSGGNINFFAGNGINIGSGGVIQGIGGSAGSSATNTGGRVQFGGGNGCPSCDHGADVILFGGGNGSAGAAQLIGGDGVIDQGGAAQLFGGVALAASGQAGGDASSTGGAGDGVGRGGHSIMNTGAPGASGVNGSLLFQINGISIAQAAGSGTAAGSSSGWLFGASGNGSSNHHGYQGTAPAVSACGTGPSIDAHASDSAGTVTVGTVAAASCTVTFASAYATWNHCRVTSQSTIASFAYNYTLSAITVTGTSLVSDKFDYQCDGS